MPTLRNIFTKTFSSIFFSIFKVIKKIFSLFNKILDFELDNDSSKINWFYTLFYFFLLGLNIIWFLSIRFYPEDFDFPIIPVSFFPIFFGMCTFYLSFYYFRHAKNKTKSKGKKYPLIILAIILTLSAIGGIFDAITSSDRYRYYE